MTTKENEMSERELTDKLKPEYQRILDGMDFAIFVSPFVVAKYVALGCESLAEQQAKELAALRKAILNQCGSELAESIEIEAHHAK